MAVRRVSRPSGRPTLPPRRDPEYMTIYMREYYRPDMPEDTRKALQNAYAFFSRRGLTRRKLLTGSSAVPLAMLLERSPSTRSERLDAWQQEASRLKQLLANRQDPAALQEVRDGALALQGLLRAHNCRDVEGARLWMSCDELLRDAGVEVSSPGTIQGLQEYARRVVEWRKIDNDYCGLVEALLVEFNLYRSEHHKAWDANWRKARESIRAAYHILQGPCHQHSQNQERLARLKHQVALWTLRLMGKDAKEPESHNAKDQLELMQALAREINAPTVWWETYREEAGYFTYLYTTTGIHRYWDQAEKSLAEAQALLSTLPSPLPEYRLRLLRAEIELLLAKREPECARLRMREFINLWPYCPVVYYQRLMYHWKDAYGLELPAEVLSCPAYFNAMLTCLYEN